MFAPVLMMVDLTSIHHLDGAARCRQRHRAGDRQPDSRVFHSHQHLFRENAACLDKRAALK
jgi:hypothetical protein